MLAGTVQHQKYEHEGKLIGDKAEKQQADSSENIRDGGDPDITQLLSMRSAPRQKPAALWAFQK
jgi:hypothetical protein